jgi:tripartite-type tricarboxylate transporter receptor subunit TctC
MTAHRLFKAALILAVTAELHSFAGAQDTTDYPSKPVRVILPQAPGGGTDTQARLYAAKLSENLRRQFIVENRAGAGNTAGPAFVAKSPADGYTLLAVTPSFTFASALYKNLSYDSIKDFAPISLMTLSPYLLVVHPSVPVKSVKELIALAKARPGRLNFGGGASGSATHLAAMLLISLANLKVAYIPYKGAGPALYDLIGGQIDAIFSTGVSTIPQIKAGKLRALGISTARRSAIAPDLPTVAEQGVPGYEVSTFHGWAAPAGTPSAIINKLSGELAKVAKYPDIVEKLKEDGSEPVGSSPEQFRQLIAAEVVRWRKLVKDIDLKIEP